MSDGITDMMREKNAADAQNSSEKLEDEYQELLALKTGSPSPYTVTLTFDMTDRDGRRHLRDALQGSDMRLALFNFWQDLTIYADHGGENTKYEYATQKEVFVGLLRDLDEYLDCYCIRLDEE